MKASDFRRSLIKYCEDHSSYEAQYLYHLRRETYLKTLAPQMLSGHLQGNLLTMISHMIHPKVIVEIGTFTGYAALCMANGLAPEGKLITIEANLELSHISQKAFDESPFKDKIIPLQGDAKDILKTLDDSIDLVFIDAGKKDYPMYFDLVIEKVRSGGFILADNVLWDGKVITSPNDAMTKELMAFNKKVLDDPRVEQMILPLRDGITVIRKL